MAFGHGKDSRVLLNETNPSGYITDYTTSAGRALANVTCLGATGHSFLPGLRVGGFSVRGPLDLTGVLHSEVNGNLGTDNGALWTVFPSGWTIGQPAFVCASDLESYNLTSTPTDAVRVDVSAQPDSGVDWGVSLHALGAETADGNATSVDNAAGTSNGGVATIHATAYSGLTNAIVKVQHSTDNSSWNDLVTFATITAATSERVLVAAGTTVSRYLRANVDVTGTGSVTYAVAFARR